MKLFASIGLLVLVGAVGLGLRSEAFQSDKGAANVFENVENLTLNNPAPQVESEPVLGALTSPDISSPYLCVNEDCTFYLSQTFIDASTTIASIPNPFTVATSTKTPNSPLLAGDTSNGRVGATSTVEFVRATITGAATSTFTLNCGAAPTAFSDPVAAPLAINSDSIPTSTVATVVNNSTSTYGGLIGGGNSPRIMLTPANPYLVCKVTSVYTGAFTEATNTFNGRLNVRISKQQF